MLELPSLLFYLFSGLTLLSGLLVITVRNPVLSVFFLIFAFFNAAAMLLLVGAEYIAMTLVIVYVGAVAVLFLFVVMMLNVNTAELKQGFLRYLPFGAFVGFVLLAELALIFNVSSQLPGYQVVMNQATAIPDNVTNTGAIGNLLYTHYVFPFQVAGLILLVAMIGAIVLTLRHKTDVRRQVINRQLKRTREQAISIVKVQPGQGA